MLLTLMFHNVIKAENADFVEQFEHYVLALATRYKIVVPGEPMALHKLSICLTFDDAYVDFYHIVFPLLKRLNIRAVLAVPTAYILDDTTEDMAARLAIATPTAMDEGVWQKAPLCTWQELSEMTNSGHVVVASHTQHHMSAKDPKLDMAQQYIESKRILEQKLQIEISTFIYPYGDITPSAHRFVKQHYQYIMRIHNAINFNWGGTLQLLYRKNGDRLCQQKLLPDIKMLSYFLFKWFYHRLRRQ